MTPGDVLYIPRGQYHDAVATSEASLHLSFGLVPYTGHDFMTVLLRSLFTDPLFRQAMPHFDDTQAYDAHLRRLAERLYEIITDVATARQSRQEQRRRVLRDSLARFALPQRDPVSLYRVRWVGATLQPRGDGSLLTTASGEYALSGNETKIVEWILSRDFFDANTIGQAFDTTRPADVSVLTDKLIAADLIEVV
jgi:ribosomal protein L16 Arg81 hydroxylase